IRGNNRSCTSYETQRTYFEVAPCLCQPTGRAFCPRTATIGSIAAQLSSASYNARLPFRANGLTTRADPMPLNVPITEDMVRGMSPDDATWNKATDLVGSDRLVNPGVSADGTWLLADAKGAAKDAYHVSVDFVDPNHPVARSNSPDRHTPDKY